MALRVRSCAAVRLRLRRGRLSRFVGGRYLDLGYGFVAVEVVGGEDVAALRLLSAYEILDAPFAVEDGDVADVGLGRLGGVVFGTGNYVDLCTAGAYGYVEARSEDGELDFYCRGCRRNPSRISRGPTC